MSLQPNPLNQFRLYNYRLSLSAVTKEQYNSGNYLDSERLVIARSGGTPAGREIYKHMPKNSWE